MMEIKTEPNQSDELYSGGKNGNIVDINSKQAVSESKIHMSVLNKQIF